MTKAQRFFDFTTVSGEFRLRSVAKKLLTFPL
jgi:hypothetical protein